MDEINFVEKYISECNLKKSSDLPMNRSGLEGTIDINVSREKSERQLKAIQLCPISVSK